MPLILCRSLAVLPLCLVSAGFAQEDAKKDLERRQLYNECRPMGLEVTGEVWDPSLTDSGKAYLSKAFNSLVEATERAARQRLIDEGIYTESWKEAGMSLLSIHVVELSGNLLYEIAYFKPVTDDFGNRFPAPSYQRSYPHVMGDSTKGKGPPLGVALDFFVLAYFRANLECRP